MNSEFRNWSDIRVFLAVLREGSTLAASRKLGMAQPTVARRIDALEHETGLTLFERDTRGFRPTAAATTLLPLAESFERAAAALNEQVIDLSEVKPIRITAYTANFSRRITKIFTDYSLANPTVQFDFLPSTLPLDLMAGEADIALRITMSPPHPDLISRKISTPQFTLYGSPAYAKAHGLPKSPEALHGHKFVTVHREGTPSNFHDWITERVEPGQIVGTFNEMETAISAVRSGVGLGFDNLQRAKNDTDLIACFDPPPELDSQQLMLISPKAYRRPEVRRFVKYFAPRYAAIFKSPPKAN